jgi:LacI family transcriptional regulator
MSTDTQPITIRDVAAAAGVSPSTVSRVLTDSVHVADDKRAAVLAAIERLHFRPSLTARGLVRGRSWEIGVLAQGISSPFYSLVLAGIADGLQDSGYQPIFAEGYSADLVIRALTTFVDRHADALIVVGGQTPDKLLLDLAEQLPVVAVGRSMSGRERQCLQVSHLEGAYAATRHLLELGHTRIAHITGLRSHPDSAERIEGYTRALREAGLEADPRLIVNGDWQEPSGVAGVQTLFGRKLPFTAVFAGNDQIAYGAMLALHGRGLRVPLDVSIVGFDDQRGATYTNPPLTTVHQPMEEMGRAAAQGVLRLLRGEDLALPVFATTLVVRDSTVRCPAPAERRHRVGSFGGAVSPGRPRRNRNTPSRTPDGGRG